MSLTLSARLADERVRNYLPWFTTLLPHPKNCDNAYLRKFSWKIATHAVCSKCIMMVPREAYSRESASKTPNKKACGLGFCECVA